MAANAQVPKAATGNSQGTPEEWTEEQLEDALEKLKILHVKCRELRTTIPRMLEPLALKHTTPQDALNTLQKSVAGASTEIEDFRSLYKSEDTKKVFDQAQKSRQVQPKDIKAWRARDHPDWLDVKEKASST
ncbi:hypothetical protein PFICI_04054 [Pestalotiopsis fici W106-1]|uniref:Uncharacterized protein n=1 Tax=Pestalotiopsis fici (strain W106-1 / CGMCC3.15140) TaxID=1229662 RepID=W3XJ31_PESFW|nr:uncharacterized protein PFICI_04054 [Pestalotiopsis fici W106-1]ETS86029.1 hypothetical protein PFICI_04054 [Pestalotiopsis fici W106-1]